MEVKADEVDTGVATVVVAAAGPETTVAAVWGRVSWGFGEGVLRLMGEEAGWISDPDQLVPDVLEG